MALKWIRLSSCFLGLFLFATSAVRANDCPHALALIAAYFAPDGYKLINPNDPNDGALKPKFSKHIDIKMKRVGDDVHIRVSSPADSSEDMQVGELIFSPSNDAEEIPAIRWTGDLESKAEDWGLPAIWANETKATLSKIILTDPMLQRFYKSMVLKQSESEYWVAVTVEAMPDGELIELDESPIVVEEESPSKSQDSSEKYNGPLIELDDASASGEEMTPQSSTPTQDASQEKKRPDNSSTIKENPPPAKSKIQQSKVSIRPKLPTHKDPS